MKKEPLFEKSAIVVAFATFVAFMGIGVVDPLLPLIAKEMGASAFDVEWLFTSYIAVMAIAMLIAGWLSTTIGNRRTLIFGLSTVVIFSTLSGLSPNIPIFAIYRGFWGLGNALFTTTALSIIVGLSSKGNIIRSITLYEAALGLGISSGPLLGGILGSFSWRYPFFGTATLMAIGLILTISMIKEPPIKEVKKNPSDVFKALKDRGVKLNALIALGYNFGFFTILAYSPLTIADLSTFTLGTIYFYWGILVAFFSVVIFNLMTKKFSNIKVFLTSLASFAIILVSLSMSNSLVRPFLIILSGISCGLNNSILTSNAISISPYSRSISSAAYNLIRWSGAAIAPVLDGFIADKFGLLLSYDIAFLISLVTIVFTLINMKFIEERLKIVKEISERESLTV